MNESIQQETRNLPPASTTTTSIRLCYRRLAIESLYIKAKETCNAAELGFCDAILVYKV